MSGFEISLIVTGSIIALGLLIYGIYWLVMKYREGLINDQSDITDKELLLFIDSQLNGMASAAFISEHFHLSKSMVRKRLNYLSQYSVLRYVGNHNGMKRFYKLSLPIKKDLPTLSSDSFLTVQDILTLLEYSNYALSLLDICMATGLPVVVIRREMQYFIELKMIDEILMSTTDSAGEVILNNRYYTIAEAYKNDPGRMLIEEEKLNLELEKISEEVLKS